MKVLAIIVTTAVAAAAAAALASPRQDDIRITLVDTAVISVRRLHESSGVAASSRPGVYWTHNDSGDGPFMYAIDSAGRDLGAWRIEGAANRDWEDMAAGPCVVRPGRCLYFGDIGDNGRRRRHVTVYRIEEPAPPHTAARETSTVRLLDSIVLRYDDLPHNAEGLVVTRDGRLLVAAKDLRGPALLFSALADQPAATLTTLCSLNIRVEPLRGRIVTGMAISPDQRVLAVRTYVSVHFFRTDRACTPLTPPNGLVIPVVETQGEAITFDGSGNRLVLTSERGEADHAILTRLRIEGLP